MRKGETGKGRKRGRVEGRGEVRRGEGDKKKKYTGRG